MSYRAVWRSAHQLVMDHFDDAPIQAAMNADAAMADGDLDGYQFWRVIAAMKEMGRKVPVSGERLN
jgi:hypothetical protein